MAASPAPAPSALVGAANRLLLAVRIRPSEVPPIATLRELQLNASSLSVAVFEACFAQRVAGVRRAPARDEDYAFNAQRIVDGLRAVLPPRVVVPASVTGEAVQRGDLATLAFLVSLFTDIARDIG